MNMFLIRFRIYGANYPILHVVIETLPIAQMTWDRLNREFDMVSARP